MTVRPELAALGIAIGVLGFCVGAIGLSLAGSLLVVASVTGAVNEASRRARATGTDIGSNAAPPGGRRRMRPVTWR